MKKLLTFVLVILPISAMADESGSCGNNLTWTYMEATQTLTIQGSGEMNDYGYDNTGKETVTPWKKFKNIIKKIVIESGVVSIGKSAFSGCNELEELSISNTVTSLGCESFMNCKNLTNIVIPDNVTSIGGYCFSGCSNISNVSLSSNLSTLSGGAFARCSKLESVIVPGSVGILKGSVFQGCTGLKSVILSEGISEIDHLAFDNCTSLTSIVFPNSLVKFYGGTFTNCTSLESITLPKNLTTIDGEAFRGCTNLKDLIIEDCDSDLFFSNPYTTSKIVYFRDCPLEKVYIGRNIGRDNNVTLFVDNKNLKEVSFGENVTTINSGEFYGCENLSSITFSNSIDTICIDAFSHCKSLRNVVIPNNVTYIGGCAFYACDSLKEVIIEDGSTELAFGTEYINGSMCFSGLLNKVYLGRNTTCRLSPFNSLSDATEVIIGKTVTKLSGGIFASIKGISKLIIEANCEPLMFEEFYHSYQNTIMPFWNTPIDSIYLDRYIISKKHELSKQYPYAFRGVSSISTLEIGSNVDKLPKDLFSSNCNITTLDIPKNIKTIEESAFIGCSNLSLVNIEDCEDKLEFADGTTFYGCPLQYVYVGRNISYPSNNSPFKNHKEGIESIIIGESVTEICNEEFYGLKKITSITLPQNLKTIGSMAFYGCEGLTEMVIPESVEAIYNQAFDLCGNIKKLTIADGVKTLNFTSSSTNTLNCAFANSPIEEVYLGRNFSFIGNSPLSLFETLKSLTIGEDVSGLAERSFIGCPNLKDVTSYSKVVPATSGVVFTPSYISSATLHVSYALYDEYINANVWKDFGAIVNFEGLYNLIYNVNGEEYKKIVVEQGTSITVETEPTKEGYTFSGWSEIPTIMPAHDVIVTSTFTINKYQVKFMYNGEVVKVDSVEYGAVIPLPTSLNSDRYTLIEWLDVPETMPAHDITIYASVVDGILTLTDEVDYKIYNERGLRISRLQRGLNIIKYSNGRIRKVIVK